MTATLTTREISIDTGEYRGFDYIVDLYTTTEFRIVKRKIYRRIRQPPPIQATSRRRQRPHQARRPDRPPTPHQRRSCPGRLDPRQPEGATKLSHPRPGPPSSRGAGPPFCSSVRARHTPPHPAHADIGIPMCRFPYRRSLFDSTIPCITSSPASSLLNELPTSEVCRPPRGSHISLM